MSDISENNRTCPALGLKDDNGTSLDFPSNSNYCHRSKPVSVPRFKHQEDFCLGGKHGECPVFLNQKTMPLPKDLRIQQRLSQDSSRKVRRNFSIAAVLVLAVLAIAWRIISQSAAAEETPATIAVVVTNPPTPTVAVFPTESLLLPLMPTATKKSSDALTSDEAIFTITPIPTSVLSKNQLEVPIGSDYKFVIHKILEGETMEQFAEKYRTSVEAIKAVNYTGRTPGWSGTLLVIPLGFTDYEKLPSFIVYEVKDGLRGISIEDMAKRLHVSPQELKYYNGWTSAGDRPLVGDYLLVPRPRATQ